MVSHVLPVQLTSLIGRDAEIATVRRLLARTRLLTLSGPGGVGKTRLALAVASKVRSASRDGLLWVELATLSPVSPLPEVVAAALGLNEAPGVAATRAMIDYLTTRHFLLCLDNCEHLAATCAALAATLLARCPNLRLLVTSREPLGLIGETVWRVPSLSLPAGPTPAAVDSLKNSEAVRLFVERAAALHQGFALNDRNAAAVVDICRRLDGLPLPIELAAAQARVLTPQQILDRLDRQMAALGIGGRVPGPDPKFGTLWASLAWSHELLAPEEQMLFRRLAVLSGAFDLSAVEAVCASQELPRESVMSVLTRLVDKSLVLMQAGGAEARYRLLDTIRSYAAERLEEAGETPRLKERHFLFYLERAEAASASSAYRAPSLDEDYANLRVAVLYSLDDVVDSEQALRMAAALSSLQWVRGSIAESRAWVERALERSDAKLRSLARAGALRTAGQLAWWLRDYEVAEAHLVESLAICRELGPDAADSRASSLSVLALLSIDRHEYVAGRSYAEEALRWFRQSGNLAGAARAQRHLADIYVLEGDTNSARPLLEDSLALARSIGAARLITRVLRSMAFLAAAEGNKTSARACRREELAISGQAGDRWGVFLALNSVASLGMQQGDRRGAEMAVRLWGQCETLAAELGLRNQASQPSARDQELAQAHARLDAPTFAEAWARGRRLTFEQAVDYGLAILDAEQRQVSTVLRAAEQQFEGLTFREHEVALLVAEGLSNRQIAEKLVLSQRTVTTHVSHILAKLDLSSRSQIAALAHHRQQNE